MATEHTAPETIEMYLSRLDDGDFERAAELFTEDTVYNHPPDFEGVTVVEGRRELLEYFTDIRGPRDHTHEIERSVHDGDRGSVVGTSTGPDHNRRFVAYAELESGRISYYIAGTLG